MKMSYFNIEGDKQFEDGLQIDFRSEKESVQN
jgi:hypothetical protein